MTDPTLKRSSVLIKYTGSDGYSFECLTNSRHTEGGPEMPLMVAFEELSRILHLFGHGEQAMKAAQEAAQRVADWRAGRALPTPSQEGQP